MVECDQNCGQVPRLSCGKALIIWTLFYIKLNFKQKRSRLKLIESSTVVTVVKIYSLPRSALADMTQIAIRESIPFIFLFIINYYFLFSSQVFNFSLCNEKLFFLLIFIKMDKII